MDSADLKPEQVRRLLADVVRQLTFLDKLVDRMMKLRFPDEDPLWRESLRARAAVQNLLIAAQGAGHGDKNYWRQRKRMETNSEDKPA